MEKLMIYSFYFRFNHLFFQKSIFSLIVDILSIISVIELAFVSKNFAEHTTKLFYNGTKIKK